MSCFKTFDYFPKFTADNISRPTLIGAVFSISALAIMFVLLYKEICEYINPTIVKETILYHERDQNSNLDLTLHMHFYHMPCSILSVDQEDILGNHNKDIHETLIKHRYDKNHTVIQELVEKDPDEFLKAIDEDEQCQLSGHIEIKRIPGNIHVSNHAYRNEMERLRNERPNLFPKITLSHKIRKFDYGSYKAEHAIHRRFGVSEHTDFDRYHEFPDFRVDTRMNFEYYMKIIPYIFVDEERDVTTKGYQFSLNFKKKEYIENPKKMPIVKINYDFSPVSMRITRKKKELPIVIGNACAIIGGIFVIFGLVNRMWLACCLNEKKD